MVYFKNFKSWSVLKEKIDNSDKNLRSFKEGQIWWVNLGINVGYEEDGKGIRFTRPVLILKKFNKELFLAVPLSTVIKPNRYYIEIKTQNGKNSALISQIRVLSSKRLVNFLCKANKNDIQRISDSIRKIMPLQ